MHAYIKYISEYFPKKIYSNDDFFEEFPTQINKQATLKKVGVSNRHIVENSVTSADLAVSVAKKLFTEHGVSAKDIDFIIFCSLEFDYTLPTTASIVHDRLGLSANVGAIDIVSSCTGFIHSLSIAKGMIEGVGFKNVLMIFPSTLTKTFHKKDFNSKFLFGDAATAVFVSSRSNFGIGNFVLGTDGSKSDYIIVKDGRGRTPINEDSFKEDINEYGNSTCRANFFMNGMSVFLFGVKTVPKLVHEILKNNHTTIDKIDFFVFHQANGFLLETLRKKLDIPKEKFIIYMENTGNTVASTIPLAMNSIVKKGVLKKGDTILFAAFGTGLTWGGTIINY